MPGKSKGGKHPEKGKQNDERREQLVVKVEGQVYAQVTRMLGNSRVECQCFDGQRRLCHIRGGMRKKVWISAGDTVLVSLRDFQDAKGDIIHKYNAEEARSLQLVVGSATHEAEDSPFDFAGI